MALIKVSFVMLVAVVACTYAEWGGGRQQQQGGWGQQQGGWEQQGQMQGANGNRGSRQSLGRQQDDQGNGSGSRQFGGEEDSKKYRANLYNDDDLYGYDAEIPAAKMFYVNYRNNDARGRRGQEFARFRSTFGGEGDERSSSRQGQNGGGRNGGGSQWSAGGNAGGRNGGGSQWSAGGSAGGRNQRASMGRSMQDQPQW